jgi:hypothetical protein
MRCWRGCCGRGRGAVVGLPPAGRDAVAPLSVDVGCLLTKKKAWSRTRFTGGGASDEVLAGLQRRAVTNYNVTR